MKNKRIEEFLDAWEKGSIPFSFVYNGVNSGQFLRKWQVSRNLYSDSETGLEITCELKIFEEFSALEWVLYFENKGKEDTPIIANIQALDIKIEREKEGEFILHCANGSTCSSTDFLPIDEVLWPNKKLDIAPGGGRSSNGNMPFFNLEWNTKGLVIAVGWSGQWQASFYRDAGKKLQILAGMQKTHLKLHPGERIRTPRILLIFWEGDNRILEHNFVYEAKFFHLPSVRDDNRILGHNLLRRVLLTHYVPKKDGKPVFPPVAHNTFFTFNQGNKVTEENQIEVIKLLPSLGIEAFWLDAGWFEGGWPTGVGNWFPKKNAFPNGLKPLGDEAHKLGMKFVVWFEPERVSKESQIAKKHSEWVLYSEGNKYGLFNLGIPEAREWLTNHISNMINEYGIDIYRHDFNINPLQFWLEADEPDRQGITEIRYIEGLYKFWDELLKRHPGLIIDNCASGGRRIDLETISRSIPLWHSDTQCFVYPSMHIHNQAQNAGLNLWIPLHSCGVWCFDHYAWRSAITGGACLCPDPRSKNFPKTQAKKAIAELKKLRPYFLGDYYPLFDINVNETCWFGYQFDRPDLGEGMVLIFRREESPYPIAEIKLKALNPDAKYELNFVDIGKRKIGTGRKFSQLKITIPSAPGSMLITYKRK